MKKIIFFALISVFFLASLNAADMLEIKNGIFPGYKYYSARETALGGIEAIGVQSSAALLSNPALLADSKSMISTDFTLSLNSLDETKMYAAVDGFDSFLCYNRYSNNTNYDIKFAGGINLGYLKNYFNTHIALGMYPILDGNYKYEEEYYNSDPNDAKLEQRLLDEYEGKGYIYTLGFAMQPIDMLSLGLSYGYIAGNIKYDYKIYEYSNGAITNTTVNAKVDDDFSAPAYIAFGAKVNYQRLGLGLSFIAPYTIEYDDASMKIMDTAAGAYYYSEMTNPMEIKLGFEYSPRNIELLSVYMEGNFKMLESAEIKLEERNNDEVLGTLTLDGKDDMHLKNTFDFKIGVEHIFLEKYPIRLGYTSYQSPIDSSVRKNGFSFGTGMKLFNSLEIDTALAFNRATYRYADIYADWHEATGANDFRANNMNDKIMQNEYSAQVTLKYSF